MGFAVIVVSFFESVVRDHSKDHSGDRTYISRTRSPGSSYTNAMDSTERRLRLSCPTRGRYAWGWLLTRLTLVVRRVSAASLVSHERLVCVGRRAHSTGGEWVRMGLGEARGAGGTAYVHPA
jgi:hypothetical protein